jgi:alpha-glucosidase
MSWQPAPDGVLAFDRGAATDAGGTVRCIANLSGAPLALPPEATVLLASGPLDGDALPPDTTAWLRF